MLLSPYKKINKKRLFSQPDSMIKYSVTIIDINTVYCILYGIVCFLFFPFDVLPLPVLVSMICQLTL
jgi:hypothetical protein